ncbi:porin [Rhizobium sp. YIM 134829]|uniref:porin n=1 Tax=Rhizobium sp. YIM 134829 TaxID=3390453 RepID=UPI003977FCEA
MNIKSLLLGSAAALAAVSGAQAADAIVAAEPEAVEYVKVCDAFGKGYFYIPGTETCLKIGGYIRTQINFKENGYGNGKGDYDPFGRGYLTFEAKSDTEYGALTGYINLEFDDADNAGAGKILDGAWINIAGFDIGYFYNWWDDGIAGETDGLGSNLTNAIRYTYEGGGFIAGAAIEEIENGTDSDSNNNIGVDGKIGYTVGGVSAYGLAAYDFDAEESAYRVVATAAIGPGTFAIAGLYATGKSFYYSDSKWVVATSYDLKATDKLTITPGFQYSGDVDFVDGKDAWKAGVAAAYKITDGLKTVVSVQYKDVDGPNDNHWSGYLRLQRDF